MCLLGATGKGKRNTGVAAKWSDAKTRNGLDKLRNGLTRKRRLHLTLGRLTKNKWDNNKSHPSSSSVLAPPPRRFLRLLPPNISLRPPAPPSARSVPSRRHPLIHVIVAVEDTAQEVLGTEEDFFAHDNLQYAFPPVWTEKLRNRLADRLGGKSR